MVHHHHGRRRQSRLFNRMPINGETLLAESLTSGASKPASGLATTVRSPSDPIDCPLPPRLAPPSTAACAPTEMIFYLRFAPDPQSLNPSHCSIAHSSDQHSSFDRTQNSSFECYTTFWPLDCARAVWQFPFPMTGKMESHVKQALGLILIVSGTFHWRCRRGGGDFHAAGPGTRRTARLR